MRVRRALLSVSDRRGLVDFARGLDELGVEIVSTGGTARELTAAGLPVRAVDDLTGFPEILDGRVKTLHPKLHAALLAVRSDPAHVASVAEHDIEWVDLVCVNLYAFERTAARRGVADDVVLEQIDVGGPALIRAAAKNHPFTAVVVRPESYDAVLEELRVAQGRISLRTREALAGDAFAYTARYDTAIARWFAERSEEFPSLFVRAFEKVTDLPYGENPHQRGAYYQQVGARMHVLSMVRQHHGRQLSFNNLLDLDAARALLRDFEVPACAIIKHGTPCGVALGRDATEAYKRAYAADPLSAFGGVIVVNRKVDLAAARALSEQFLEVLVAPGYDEDALALLCEKPELRLLEDNERRRPLPGDPDVRQVTGGVVVQDSDFGVEDRMEMEVVTATQPSEAQWSEMLFAWRVAKHVRSNAIVLTRDLATVGIGAGQMSRVDSVRLAIDKSGTASLEEAALASDGFFPFADGPELAIAAGVRMIVQPGGSKRDDEVVEAAAQAGVIMVFSSRRHFRH
ncbi:MAG: bifunctional phosphoribosylaminoimidazolecarboxamide formyltransferase/IMP cyclohydrolase [Solirubrobacterales bacterium]|nr:bifunctional phosphoribosylaminoimidazolecarboxamide formyltransferase/IMP cyclohydrolase [Solirubrobacterales bacterium]